MKMWLRLGLLVGLTASAIGAVDWNALKPQGHVSDFAGVIDPIHRGRLEAYCEAVERSTGTRISVVIIPSLEGEPVADVARAFHRAWAADQKSRAGSVLLLMTVRDRRVRVATAGGLESILSDSAVLREMRPALRERDYAEAAMAAAESIGVTLAKARKIGLPATLPRRLRPGAFDWFLWPVLVGAVLLVLGLMRLGGVRGDGSGTGGGLLPGLLRGRATARSTWGANGSGGFGGYDSGDGGFGGFGGGDCPGGHASDW